ncbi:CAP domain-containing protein [Aquimarina sp. 2-A2]|uniref:CAP domain-containing protein n=1 Tax=Aquimarina sp. 2-A2 TaxID=3382644 RepID=UPI00387EF255
MKIYVKQFLLLFVTITILSCSKDNDDQIDENTKTQESEISVESEILRLVNEHRISLDLPVLEITSIANTLAKEHTTYMIEKSAISHDNFDARFTKLRSEVNATNAAENVASFQPTAQSVVTAWLNSSGHRKNIEGNFVFTGISAVKDSEGRYYYTQIFHN